MMNDELEKQYQAAVEDSPRRRCGRAVEDLVVTVRREVAADLRWLADIFEVPDIKQEAEDGPEDE